MQNSEHLVKFTILHIPAYIRLIIYRYTIQRLKIVPENKQAKSVLAQMDLKVYENTEDNAPKGSLWDFLVE